MAKAVLFVELGIDATNDDILDQMRIIKQGREEGIYQFVVCTIRGFADDRRDLSEIPEVRAFCRRIVNLGFISYLEVTTLFDLHLPAEAKRCWGATEVWLCSENRLKAEIEMDKPLLLELQQVIGESNERADAAIGPMR